MVDTSSYPHFQPVTPMQQIEQTVGIAGGLQNLQHTQQENKLLQMKVLGQQGLQRILSDPSVRDTQGGINTVNFLKEIMADPTTAFMAPEIAQQNMVLNEPVHSVDRQGNPIAKPRQHWMDSMQPRSQPVQPMQPQAQPQAQPTPEKISQVRNYVNTMKSSLDELMANPNATAEDVKKHAKALVDTGGITPQALASELKNMPKEGPELQKWFKSHYDKNESYKAALDQMFPQEEPPVEQGTSVTGNAPQAQPMSQQATPALQQEEPEDFVRTGPKLGQEAMSSTMGAGAGNRANEIIAQATDVGVRKNVIESALRLSQEGVKTGPTKEWQNKMLGNLIDAIPKEWADKLDAEKEPVVKFQVMQKMLARLLTDSGATLGTPTNDKIDILSHVQPNSAHFPEALGELLRYSYAGELAKQAKADAMYNLTGGNYTPQNVQNFEHAWTDNADFNVFLLPILDTKERKSMLDALGPEGRSDLKRKVNTLEKMGALGMKSNLPSHAPQPQAGGQ